jgi:hypothetical protein
MGTGDTTGTGGLGLFSGQADIGRLSTPGLCAYDAERQSYTIASPPCVTALAGAFKPTTRSRNARQPCR